MGRSQRSVSSRAGHVTMETVFGQTLALRFGDGDEHRALESDTTGLNVKGNLYLYLYVCVWGGEMKNIGRLEFMVLYFSPRATFLMVIPIMPHC